MAGPASGGARPRALGIAYLFFFPPLFGAFFSAPSGFFPAPFRFFSAPLGFFSAPVGSRAKQGPKKTQRGLVIFFSPFLAGGGARAYQTSQIQTVSNVLAKPRRQSICAFPYVWFPVAHKVTPFLG